MLRKNQIMITALALMIAVAGYLNFAGTKIGEEDFISVDGSNSELTYEISDEDTMNADMYAISLREDTEGTIADYSQQAAATDANGDILSLDTDDAAITENYLTEGMDTNALAADTAATNNMTDSNLQANAEAAESHGVLAANSEENADANIIEQEVPGEAVFTSASGVSTIAGANLLKEQTRAQNKESLMEIINNESLTEEAKKDAVNTMITLTETAQKESDAQMLLEAKGFAQTVVSISGDSADVMVAATSLTEAQTAQIIDIVQRKTEIAPENIIITVSAQ
ncbi:MAG: SpoIIIAH-like family protein [Lachnospiraceae bacterium]|nr:SpoIIIAH-like family protein [Lachnospiraceae bacterium]MCI9401299.1 SpoIIIAH-like family protein [Lachnospiraceae bacterium]